MFFHYLIAAITVISILAAGWAVGWYGMAFLFWLSDQ